MCAGWLEPRCTSKLVRDGWSCKDIMVGGVLVPGRKSELPPRACSSPSVIWVEPGREGVFPPVLSRRIESTVVELPFRPLNGRPSLCPEILGVESQASPAALEDTGGGPEDLPPEALGDFEGFLPSLGPRKVVNITRPPFLSGLGVRDVFFIGRGGVGAMFCAGGAIILIRGICGLLYDRSVGELEPFRGKAGR